ncbi:hypothetical protein PPSIR1_06086 [Plesiocystis pacifica SIR-1]|uniref:Uncharacterized protein n=1 Tax=Plesiocystis pacifica SIR-1 TaxID=391625 RepID=A6G6U2_9BACT|nr:hypothetical protein [Plesiocystis pacifica]EDM78395.1 hypothetical protein PPSIR1_06086 [Plesiocystis pacifica SIR-1]
MSAHINALLPGVLGLFLLLSPLSWLTKASGGKEKQALAMARAVGALLLIAGVFQAFAFYMS